LDALGQRRSPSLLLLVSSALLVLSPVLFCKDPTKGRRRGDPRHNRPAPQTLGRHRDDFRLEKTVRSVMEVCAQRDKSVGWRRTLVALVPTRLWGGCGSSRRQKSAIRETTYKIVCAAGRTPESVP
jgi:hypothetical protein